MRNTILHQSPSALTSHRRTNRSALHRAASAVFEQLEDRQHLSGTVASDPNYPDFRAEYPGSVVYTAGPASSPTGSFKATGTLIWVVPGPGSLTSIPAADRVSNGLVIQATITKSDGSLAGGVDGVYDLMVDGNVTLPAGTFNGVAVPQRTYNGTLLVGEVRRFAFDTSGSVFTFGFSLEGGFLANDPAFVGREIGAIVNRVPGGGYTTPTALPNGFASDFGGLPKIVLGSVFETASLGDRVWDDANANGIQDNGESGIAGVTVQLLNREGNVIATTTTDADGYYLFSGLTPDYYGVQVVAPNGYRFSPANQGADDTLDSDADTTGRIGSALLVSNTHDRSWDVGLVQLPSSLSGHVYVDSNDDGKFGCGEKPLAGVTIVLTGTDDLGQDVNVTTTTNACGRYVFSNLRPGTYTLTEIQPDGYIDGKDTIGTPGGTTANDVFSNIVLAANVNGQNNNFGERIGSKLHCDQTATIGFWNNKNGQSLLLSLNGGPCSSKLGTWLAANFPNLFGSLAGQTNTQVAAYYKYLFSAATSNGNGRNSCLTNLLNNLFDDCSSSPLTTFIKNLFSRPETIKLEAQLLATAFATYATDAALAGGNYAARYGFDMDRTANALWNVGTNGAAFGLANYTTVTVWSLLKRADAAASNGTLYAANSTYRTMANNIFDGINNAGDIR